MTTDLGNYDDFGISIAVHANNKILVAGYSDNGSDFDFALVWYNIYGTSDSTFSLDGIVTSDFENSFDY